VFVQDGEPNLNRIEPAGVFGRVDKTNAVLVITQIRLSGLHARENTALALYTQLLLITERTGHQVDQ